MTKPNDPWTTETGSRIKAWFVMRLDLPMSQGKFGVQVGHGTDFIHMIGDKNPYYSAWIDPNLGNRRKIALRANSLAEIEKLKAECEASGMLTQIIADAGLTEFGQPTITGLVILPHDDALIPKLLKRTQSWRPTDSNIPSDSILPVEVDYLVEEEDTDGAGNPMGWAGWGSFDTKEKATAYVTSLKPTEGRVRVTKTVTETLYIRTAKPASEL